MKFFLPEILAGFLGARKEKLDEPDAETRFVQYTMMCLSAFITMFLFGIFNFLRGKYLLCLILFCSATGLFTGWFLLYHGRAQKLVYRANSLIFSILLFYMMYLGGNENSLILWMNISPLIVFFLMGRTEGAFWTGTMWVLIVFYLFGPFEFEGRDGYSFLFSVRFLVTFSIISILTFFYENFRYLYRLDLEGKNRALTAEINEREKAELALGRANKTLEQLVHIDGLTRIANRRRFDQALEQEWRRMRRDCKGIGLIMGDVDYFKQFNDIYGHQAGDECLINIASRLSLLTRRPADIVARYGGEEFVVLLPDTSLEGSMILAERMRQEVEGLAIKHSGSSSSDYVTMSFGVSYLNPVEQESAEILIAGADKGLYVAKEAGRNCVSHQRL